MEVIELTKVYSAIKNNTRYNITTIINSIRTEWDLLVTRNGRSKKRVWQFNCRTFPGLSIHIVIDITERESRVFNINYRKDQTLIRIKTSVIKEDSVVRRGDFDQFLAHEFVINRIDEVLKVVYAIQNRIQYYENHLEWRKNGNPGRFTWDKLLTDKLEKKND